MKTRQWMLLIGLALAVNLFLGARGMDAQDRYFNAEIGNGQWSAVEPPRSFAGTDRAYFNAEIGNLPQPDAVPLWNASEEVAVDSGNFVEESQIVEDDYVPEGQSVYVLVIRRVPVQTAAHDVARLAHGK